MKHLETTQSKELNQPLFLHSGMYFAVPENVEYTIKQVRGIFKEKSGLLAVSFDCYLKPGHNLFHEGRLYLQQQPIAYNTNECLLFSVKNGQVQIVHRLIYPLMCDSWKHPAALVVQEFFQNN